MCYYYLCQYLSIVTKRFSQDSASIKVAAEIISLSFASDPLIRWLSRDRTGPGWETLTPTLQRWQEARLRGYAVQAIAMEAVTVSETPESVGSCFLFPPGSHYRWSDIFWWPACFKVAWDQCWAKPMEPFSDPEVRYLQPETSAEAN